MADEEVDQLEADAKVILKWSRYKEAQRAKSLWAAEEKDAKAELLAELGYDPTNEKPTSCSVASEDGQPLFEVVVGQRQGLDVKYLKANFPDVYAASEKVNHPISVREL